MTLRSYPLMAGGAPDGDEAGDDERQAQPWERAPRENLVRLMPRELHSIELRADAEDEAEDDLNENGMPTMRGHFAVFDTWAEIHSYWEGHFLERFQRGSFRKTFKELGSSIRVLLEHGRDPVAGNKPLGMPEELDEDDEGARYAVPLFDADYVRSIVPGLRAGAFGASFRFSVMKERWDKKPEPREDNPQGLPERTITEATVPEFGPVTFPAYVQASAGVRSLTDDFIMARLGMDPERLAGYLDHLRTGAGGSHSEVPEPAAATRGEQQSGAPTPARLAPRQAPISRDAFLKVLGN